MRKLHGDLGWVRRSALFQGENAQHCIGARGDSRVLNCWSLCSGCCYSGTLIEGARSDVKFSMLGCQ